MAILNEIARLAGWAVFMVILGCVVLVVITGIQNLIDEIKWRIRRKSIPELLHKYNLQVNIVNWGARSFSVMLTDDKNILIVQSGGCEWKDINKVISGLLKERLKEDK